MPPHRMPPHRVTLKEVAQRASVSPTTASYVLTGRGQDMRISEQARERVRQAASALRYRPNLMARGLRTKVTRNIALVSDTIATEQYAGQVVYGALVAALEHEHLLLIGETEGDGAVEARLITDFLDHQVDGFVYAKMYTQEAAVPDALRGHPLVLLNCAVQDPGVPAVLPDEREAGRSAAQTLVKAGHRDRIHVVGEPTPGVVAGRERLQGIQDVMGATGAALAGILDCRWWPEAAFEAVTTFLEAGQRPTALVCMNDRVAFGAYQALGEAGLAIPDDVSVVSFDDSDLASWLRPQLTSIALPHYDLGRRAVERLLAEPTPTGTEFVPMPVRHRGSVAPPGPELSRTSPSPGALAAVAPPWTGLGKATGRPSALG